MSPAARRTWVGWGLRALGPLILVGLVARLDHPADVARLALSVAPWPLGLALALNILPLWLKVVRWQIILRARGISYGTRSAWLAFSGALYVGMLTPGRVGDVLRIQYLRHDTGARYAEGLASVVVDRLADLYVLVALTAVAVAHYGAALSPELRLVGWGMVAASLALPLALLIPGLADRALAGVYQRIAREKEADGMAVFLTALREGVRRGVAPILACTVLAFAVNFVQGKLIADAMGLPLSFFDVVCLQSVQSMAGLLPVSISGLGVREAFFAAIFPSLGASREAGTTYGLVVFVVMYVSQVALGAVAWNIRPPPIAPRPIELVDPPKDG